VVPTSLKKAVQNEVCTRNNTFMTSWRGQSLNKARFYTAPKLSSSQRFHCRCYLLCSADPPAEAVSSPVGIFESAARQRTCGKVAENRQCRLQSSSFVQVSSVRPGLLGVWQWVCPGSGCGADQVKIVSYDLTW